MTVKNGVDYEAVLVDLEKRRAQLDVTIENIKQIVHQNNGTGASFSNQPAFSVDIANDAFSGMTISKAAQKYLRIVGKPQKVRKIAEAIEAGGLQSESKNFISTVTTVLFRKTGKNDPFVKTVKGWGLREW